MRGCFPDSGAGGALSWVFPAHAGVFPSQALRSISQFKSSPRMRGCFHLMLPMRFEPERRCQSSPRMRGCFITREQTPGRRLVFPAHAGVFPRRRRIKSNRPCLPRACGGVSKPLPTLAKDHQSSPRMRGCFDSKRDSSTPNQVFPAHAGVFVPGPPRCGY